MTVTMIDCMSVNVPAVLRQFGSGQPVAGYVTGSGGIEWTEPQFAEFSRKIRIAQSADLFLDEESIARCLDVERYAATPDDWPDWYNSRTNKAAATCYCSLSSVEAVQAACRSAGIPDPARWWLAWYWGFPGAPSAERVLAELSKYDAAGIEPGSLWAVQYRTFPQWDVSAVFGTPDFSRR